MQSIGVVFIIFILAGCGLSFVLDATNNPVAWSPAAGLALTSLHPGGSAYSSLCWNNTIQYPTMSKTVNQDWSPYKALYFSMYNNGLGTPKLMLILDSDTNRGDYDYYSYSVSLDWTGWKNFIIPLSNFNANRSPAGWNTIQKMYFSAVGWGLVNNPLTQVCFNGFELNGLSTNANFLTVDFTYGLVPGYTHQSVPLTLTNPTRTPSSYIVSYVPSSLPSGFIYLFSTTPTSAVSSSLTVTYTAASPMNITIYATLKTSKAVGSVAQVVIQLAASSDPLRVISTFTTLLQVVAPTPLSGGLTRPFLFLDNSMKAAMNGTGLKQQYAANELSLATSRLTADLTVPQQWGAWGGYFFCSDGSGLYFNSSNNTAFYCPSDKRYYSGWPYDQAWYTVRHNQVITYMQDLAIGYYLSGNTTFATAAINILVQYSIFYPALPYRDINSQTSISGGRLLSQTLDESNIMPLVANTFDLVYSRMTTTQQAIVEYNLLRAMGATIKRHNPGMSNWQSWHNAALAIVGYAVNDNSLVDYAVNGTSGFYYQLQNGVLDDGFWWENSIGYHFYTLQAMQWLLTVTSRRGNNLSNSRVPRSDGKGTKTIESMYIAPIQILEPLRKGWGTPSLNDDHSSDGYITNQAPLYVFANWQWGPAGVTPSMNQQAYSWVLTQSSNYPTIPMLFWGAQIFPGSYLPGSIDLPVTGLTILSVNATKDWALLKHGPHGGFHGHYDKLELCFDHALVTLLEDYGTVEYSQPLHYNYFKRSLAHNTILVDGISQFEASGNGLFFGTSLPDFLVMSANSTQLNTGVPVAAQRTVVLFPNLDGTGRSIAIDLLEPIKLNASAAPHEYFSVYHSSGTFQVKTGPAMTPYTIPYTAVEPAWAYFTSPSSANVPALTSLRYAWNLPGMSVQDGYESTAGWSFGTSPSLSLDTTYVKEGEYSLKWINHPARAQFSKANVITDWSSSAYLSWWMYNVVPNNALLTLVLYSENVTSSGGDYYYYRITLNWTGWKLFNVSRSSFPPSRSPVGWNKIDSVTWSSSWSSAPDPTSQVYIDAFHVYRADGSPLPDTPGSGLEVLSDSNSVARQFITATAPNQPATSFHPVAVTKITGESLFAHMLITPPAPTNIVPAFSSYLSQATYARYNFNYGSIAARVYLMRSGSTQKSSANAGVRVELVRSGVTTTSAYKVNFISPISVTDTSIGLTGTQVTGKIQAWNLSPLTCNMTAAVYDTAAYVICNFNTTASSFTYSGTLNGVTIPSSSLVKTSTKVGTATLISIKYLLPVGTRMVAFKITPA